MPQTFDGKTEALDTGADAIAADLLALFNGEGTRQVMRTGQDGALPVGMTKPRVIGWTGTINRIIAHLGARSTSGDVVVDIYYYGLANAPPGTPSATVTIPANVGGTGGGVTVDLGTPITVGNDRAQVAFQVSSAGTNASDIELTLKGFGV